MLSPREIDADGRWPEVHTYRSTKEHPKVYPAPSEFDRKSLLELRDWIDLAADEIEPRVYSTRMTASLILGPVCALSVGSAGGTLVAMATSQGRVPAGLHALFVLVILVSVGMCLAILPEKRQAAKLKSIRRLYKRRLRELEADEPAT